MVKVKLPSLMAAQTTSEKHGKEGGEREGNASGYPEKKNVSITLGSGLWKVMGFPNRPVFDYI